MSLNDIDFNVVELVGGGGGSGSRAFPFHIPFGTTKPTQQFSYLRMPPVPDLSFISFSSRSNVGLVSVYR